MHKEPWNLEFILLPDGRTSFGKGKWVVSQMNILRSLIWAFQCLHHADHGFVDKLWRYGLPPTPSHWGTCQSHKQLTLCSCLYCKSSELGWSGTPWLHQELLPRSHLTGKHQNCTFWEVLEFYGCCQDTRIGSNRCSQDGNLLMPKVNYLATL